jgi:hypothetical protein
MYCVYNYIRNHMANQYKKGLRQVQQCLVWVISYGISAAHAVGVFYLSYLFMLSESWFHRQFVLEYSHEKKINIKKKLLLNFFYSV